MLFLEICEPSHRMLNLIRFWGLKKRFCPVVKSTFQEYRGSYEQIFLISAEWKCDFSRIVKPTFEVTSQRVDVFSILEGWKCDFAQSWNPRFYGTKLRVSKFSACIKLRVSILFPHFGSLKMLFLPSRETNVSKYLAKSVGNFIFDTGKCDFAESWNQRFNCPKFSVRKFSASIKFRVTKFSAFWLPDNAFFDYFRYARFLLIFCIMDGRKIRFLPSRETRGSRVWAKFCNFGAWKRIFCRFVNSTF